AALSDAQLSGAEPLPDALPMTRQLEAAFASRIARLPAAAATLLLVAADGDALDAAERSGLLQVRGARVGFRHPLVRSAVYGTATSGERRSAHVALAEALEDDPARADGRAWHLAAG